MFDYPIKNNIVLFQKGPLSQWWGAFSGQESRFTITSQTISELVAADVDGDKHFICAEQFMMAMKALLFRDWQTYGKIMNSTSPKEHKDLGRQVANYSEESWNYVRYNIVLNGNYAKFTQNEDLKEFLLGFHQDIIFAEAAPWDKIWGIGLGPDDPQAWNVYTWQGQNLLGRVIKEVQLSI